VKKVAIFIKTYAGGYRSLFLPNSSKEEIFAQCFLCFCQSSPMEAPGKGEIGMRNWGFLEKWWEKEEAKTRV